jgi:two-component system, sensor histidine kinase
MMRRLRPFKWMRLAAPNETEWASLAHVRLSSQAERATFAIAASVTIALVFQLPWVLLWGAAQIGLILAERAVCRRIELGQYPPYPVAIAGIALVAGGNLSLGLILWPLGDGAGAAAAALFIAVGMMTSLFSLRGNFAIMVGAIAPGIAILLLAPLLEFFRTGNPAVLAVLFGLAFFLAFIVVVWRKFSDADASARLSNTEAAAARRAAERASDAKSAFLAAMSRELRTPMTAMLGAAALLQRAELSDKDRVNVDTVLEAGQVLVAVLNDLLDTARIEAGQVSFTPAPTDLNALARSVVQAWRPRADDKFLEIFCDIDRDAPPVAIVDAVRVKQILYNLVANAVKFTQHGGVRLRISATMPAIGRARYVFAVADTGPGMTEEVRAALFDLKPPTKDSVEPMFGNGLGLAICRKLAQLMGGELEIDTAPGEGSTFRLIVEATVTENIDIDPELARWDLFAQPLRILIADDHVVSRRVVGELLKQINVDVAFAGDGEEALVLLRNTKFDLVLMDINMPGIDGLEATSRLRRERGMNARTPVLALTASTLGADRVRCMEAGMDGHIGKPVDPTLLFDEINRLTHRTTRAA